MAIEAVTTGAASVVPGRVRVSPDGDGLAAPQEAACLPTLLFGCVATDPEAPDSDNDGVWDGWVGVHGVGHSENVVLYVEHLGSGDGLEGDELVPEQAGIHRVTPRAPARTAAVIDGERVHSNIHVGEQHWGADPRDDDDWPARSLSVEVDYYEPAPGQEALNSERWTGAVERNLQLYGVNATIRTDDNLTRRDLTLCEGDTAGSDIDLPPSERCIFDSHAEGGFTRADLEVVAANHHNTTAEEYVVVAHDLPLLGVSLDDSPVSGLSLEDVGLIVSSGVGTDKVRRSPYRSDVALVAGAVQLHELGHSLHIGERDDVPREVSLSGQTIVINETYSGSGLDDTPELLRPGLRRWSVMRRSWGTQLVRVPMNGRYYAFSIEELSTVKEP